MSTLKEFTEDYLECARWVEEEYAEEFGMEEQLSQVVEARIDCADFFAANRADIEVFCEALPDASAGHDFYLTRNGHGAGYWDRYYGEDAGLINCLDRLTEASRAYGEAMLCE